VASDELIVGDDDDSRRLEMRLRSSSSGIEPAVDEQEHARRLLDVL
jgi:hypothetical protein